MAEFEEIVEDELEKIDDVFSSGFVELSERPLLAARAFVEVCVVEIRGEGVSLDEYLHQQWFALLYEMVRVWYEERYGRDNLARPRRKAPGLVVINGNPFKIEVPLSISRVEEPGETAWFTVASSIHPHENPLDWILSPPNFSKLSRRNTDKLKDRIAAVAVPSRQINADRMTALLKPVIASLHAFSIDAHVTRAVDDVCSGDPVRLSNSVWESHLACERAVKAFLTAKTGSARNTHELAELISDAEAAGLPVMDPSLLAGRPSARDASKHRYAELAPLAPDAMEQLIANALRFAAHCVSALPRRLRVRDASFLIKKAPWLRGGDRGST